MADFCQFSGGWLAALHILRVCEGQGVTSDRAAVGEIAEFQSNKGQARRGGERGARGKATRAAAGAILLRPKGVSLLGKGLDTRAHAPSLGRAGLARPAQAKRDSCKVRPGCESRSQLFDLRGGPSRSGRGPWSLARLVHERFPLNLRRDSYEPLPALAVPCGEAQSSGVADRLRFALPPRRLRLAEQCHSVTQWHGLTVRIAVAAFKSPWRIDQPNYVPEMNDLETSLAVVGIDYVNADKAKSSRRFEVRLCAPGEPVELRPEPNNKHDEHAVAVFSARGIQIGYLSAERAPAIGAKIRAGKPIRAIFQREIATAAIIRVRFDGEEPTLPPAPPPEPTRIEEDYADPEGPTWGA